MRCLSQQNPLFEVSSFLEKQHALPQIVVRLSEPLWHSGKLRVDFLAKCLQLQAILEFEVTSGRHAGNSVQAICVACPRVSELAQSVYAAAGPPPVQTFPSARPDLSLRIYDKSILPRRCAARGIDSTHARKHRVACRLPLSRSAFRRPIAGAKTPSSLVRTHICHNGTRAWARM